jgi:hypothetical protein
MEANKVFGVRLSANQILPTVMKNQPYLPHLYVITVISFGNLTIDMYPWG